MIVRQRACNSNKPNPKRHKFQIMNNSNEFRKYAVHHLGMSGNTVDSYADKINGYANQIHDMTQYVIEERPGNSVPSMCSRDSSPIGLFS